MKAEEALQDSKYRCGGCGGDLYKLFKHKDKIITVCQDCGAESKIVVTPSKIDINWGDDEDLGCMTIF